MKSQNAIAENTKEHKESAKENADKTSADCIVQYWTNEFGEDLKFTFFDTNSPDDFKPHTQCYALCFNDKREIIIGRNPNVMKGGWMLPGGRAEKDETPEQTLKRELLEEMDITVNKLKLLGAQKVENIDSQRNKNRPQGYQFRYAGIIKELKAPTPDPDNGVIWERKFVKPEEVEAHLKWGQILVHLVEKATAWYDEEQKKNSPVNK